MWRAGAYGVRVARIFVAVLLGRLRPVAWLLSLDLWLPIAGLSYGAYLLKDWALAVPPPWASTGMTSLWAAPGWGTGLLALAVVIALSRPLPCPPICSWGCPSISCGPEDGDSASM